MLIHHPLRVARASRARSGARSRPVLSGLVLAGLVLSGTALAGCSTAPASAVNDSPAIGPVRTGAAALNFAPFPVPDKWTGSGGADYTMVLKAKTGTKPRKFSVTVTSNMVFWLGCIGTGTVRLVSAPLKLNWGIPCGTGQDPAGIAFIPPKAAVGTTVKIEVTSPPGTRWEVRVDAANGSAKQA